MQGNILHLTINPNQRNLHKKRIPPNMCINENLPHKERSFPPRNEGQFYTTIKTPKPSQTKIRIIFQVWHTRVVEILSNLTFEGHLASTTPILSVRSSLFLFRRFCLEHVKTVWLIDDFWHHQYIYIESSPWNLLSGLLKSCIQCKWEKLVDTIC